MFNNNEGGLTKACFFKYKAEKRREEALEIEKVLKKWATNVRRDSCFGGFVAYAP